VRQRDFLAVAVSGVALPLVAPAQQPERMRRIGVLMAYAEGGAGLGGGFPRRTSEARLGEHPDRHTLGRRRRGGYATVLASPDLVQPGAAGKSRKAAVVTCSRAYKRNKQHAGHQMDA
jgi:hypothetical protein